MVERVDNLLEGSAMTTPPRPANSHWEGGVGFSLDWLDWGLEIGEWGNRTGEWFVVYCVRRKLLTVLRGTNCT